MAPRQSIWYRIGHAYERATRGARVPRKPVTGLSERRTIEREGKGAPRDTGWPSADDLISTGAMLVLDRVIGARRRDRKPGFTGLLRAGAAGAAAALLVDLVRPLLHGDPEIPVLDRKTVDRVLAGVGQGLVYGALIEPRVPGPALIKGALYGSVEYATDPMGGLHTLLGQHTPHGQLPGVAEFLEGLDPHERAYLEHVAFGIALAILYDSRPSGNGTRQEAANDE